MIKAQFKFFPTNNSILIHFYFIQIINNKIIYSSLGDIDLKLLRLDKKKSIKNEKFIEFTIEKENEITFCITFTAPVCGKYNMEVLYNHKNINGSPFVLHVISGLEEQEKKQLQSQIRKSASYEKELKTFDFSKYEKNKQNIILCQSAIRRYQSRKQLQLIGKLS